MSDPAKIRLKPAPGRRVRDPATGEPLPAKGANFTLPLNPFWSRRLADADVVEVAAKSKPADGADA